MTFLILIVCAHGACREVKLAGPMPVFACMTSSQPIAAQWLTDHPGYTIKKLRCEAPAA